MLINKQFDHQRRDVKLAKEGSAAKLDGSIRDGIFAAEPDRGGWQLLLTKDNRSLANVAYICLSDSF